MSEILKLKYVTSRMDLASMRFGVKEKIEIDRQGKVEISKYEIGSRKVIKKDIYQTTDQEFTNLCSSLRQCIDSADRQEFFVDDCSETLTIYHEFGRVETMDRGLGNEKEFVGVIIGRFVDTVTSETNNP